MTISPQEFHERVQELTSCDNVKRITAEEYLRLDPKFYSQTRIDDDCNYAMIFEKRGYYYYTINNLVSGVIPF